MTLAREVRLTAVNGSARLVQQPVLANPAEGETLWTAKDDMTAGTFELRNSALRLPDAVPGSAYIIEAEILPGTAERCVFRLFGSSDGSEGTLLSYDTTSARLILDRRQSGNTWIHAKFASVESAPVDLENGALKLQIVVDHCSVEVFAQGGNVVLTDLIFPEADNQENWLSAVGGPATILKLGVSTLS
jgi:levanase/levanbiose-producing levanase